MLAHMGSQMDPLLNPYDSAAAYDKNANEENTEVHVDAGESNNEEASIDLESVPDQEEAVKKGPKRKIALTNHGINEYVTSKKQKMDEKGSLEVDLLQVKIAVAKKQLEIAERHLELANVDIEIKKAVLLKENTVFGTYVTQENL